MNLLQQIEREQVEKLAADRSVPKFEPGDTVRVMVRVIEGERERVQAALEFTRPIARADDYGDIRSHKVVRSPRVYRNG